MIIRNSSYDPEEIHVRVGDVVEWRNSDPFRHTVTPDDVAAWGSEGSGDDEERWLRSNATWAFRFDRAGEFRYHCIPHASLGEGGGWTGQVGRVIVEG